MAEVIPGNSPISTLDRELLGDHHLLNNPDPVESFSRHDSFQDVVVTGLEINMFLSCPW